MLADLQYILSGNTVDLGAFAGGSLPTPPSAAPNTTITTDAQCSNLFINGTYYLGADIGGCYIGGNGVTLVGQTNPNSSNGQYTIGNVTSAGGVDINLQNVTVTGNVTSSDGANGSPAVITGDPSFSYDAGNGGGSGSITISTSTVNGSVTTGSGGNGGGSGVRGGNSGSGGSTGSVVVNNSTIGGAITTGKGGDGSDANDISVTGGGGGSSGSITISNSSVGSLETGYGGKGGSSINGNEDSGSGGSSGFVTITNSTAGNIITNNAGSDGDGAYSSGSGNGGSVTVRSSTVGNIITGSGSNVPYDGIGGGGGSVSISTSTAGSVTSGAGGDSNFGVAGDGGSINITNSTTTSISAGPGGNANFFAVGSGGSIIITSTSDLDLSDKTISGGVGGTGNGGNDTNGSLTITYGNDMATNDSTYFNNVGNLNINTVDYGPWNGVFNPQTYYFNSTADGGGNDGNWNNPANWWLDTNYTTPANGMPSELNPVTVGSDITENIDAPSLANVSNLSATENTSESSVLTANNSSYTFNVYAYTVVNNGKYYSATPATITVTDDGSNNTFAWDLAWDAVSGATGYKIVGTTPAGTFGIDVEDVTAYTYDGSSNPTDTVVSPIANGTHPSPLIVRSLILRGNAKNHLTIRTKGSTFTDTSTNQGDITGNNHVFNGTSTNAGNITGTTTFNGNSTNSGTTTGVTTFNDASSNTGTVVNNATTTFNGDLASSSGLVTNSQGATTGSIQRVFTSNASTTRNYTTEAGHNNWLLVANNAVVDLTNAIYSRAANIFQALFGGSFISNPTIDNGASVVPVITISSTTIPYDTNNINTTKTIKWQPNVTWDTSSVCSYSYDDFSTTNIVDCTQHGSDIPRPSAGLHTLYLQGIDTNGNETQTAGLTFYYDNTQPVWTACGTDLLDEATRPYYYLNGNINGDCHVTTNTTLYGLSNINATTTGYTVNGSIIADATSTTNAFNITLKNITVTGQISSNGGYGYNAGSITIRNATTTAIVGNGGNSTSDTGNGGSGSNITVALSTVGSITSNGGLGGELSSIGGNAGSFSISTSTTGALIGNGGDGATRGGNGASINIVASLGIASSTITANGGNATYCGNGGNAGTITLTNSAYGTVTHVGGSAANSGCPSNHSNSGGSSGNYTPVGTYTPPGYTAPSNDNSNNNNNNTDNANNSAGVSGGGSYVYTPGLFTPGVLNGITLPNINLPGRVVFTPLPTFGGTSTKSFDFLAPITNFLNGASISWNGATALEAYITSLGISRDQDLVALRANAIPATTTKDIPGLFKVSVSTLPTKTNGTFTNTSVPITSYFTSNSELPLSQSVTILPGTTITVSLTPATKAKKITGTFNGQPVTFTLKKGVASVSLTAPSRGTYTLKTNASPIPLSITVKPPVVVAPPPPSPIQSVLDTILSWFGW